MKYKPYVLIEWPMTRNHYDVDWVVVRKKLGESFTNWLLALPQHHAQTYIYHKPDIKLAQLVIEFYRDDVERAFLQRTDNNVV